MDKASEGLSKSADMDLPDLVSQALRSLSISEVLVGAGTIGSPRANNVELGQATIERLIVRNVSASLHSSNAYLQNVCVLLNVRLSVEWWYDIGIWRDSGTENLGSLSFPVQVGNVLVPSLGNISVAIPQAAVDGVRADIAAISNLDLGGRFQRRESEHDASSIRGL